MASSNSLRSDEESLEIGGVSSIGAVDEVSIHLSGTLNKHFATGEGPPTSVNELMSAENAKRGSGEAKSSDIQGDSTESTKSSYSQDSVRTSTSDESVSTSRLIGGPNKLHKAKDARSDAIDAICMHDGRCLGLSHFRLLKRLGSGDIGSVYLSELSGSKCLFAMKVMDKGHLANRKKLIRAQTEREILACLNHPFLPTLYAHFETDKFSCLVMEFCCGGDLHTLRQQQAGRHFPERAARFYAAEVLMGLEYLHMLGIIYRDLKPENVLVRDDGHIMLSDFDLSLRTSVTPTLVKSVYNNSCNVSTAPTSLDCQRPSSMLPSTCVQPSCFLPKVFSSKSESLEPQKTKNVKNEVGRRAMPFPELVAEPTGAKSMSFVGTHEYLAPEIVKGEGHGSAVDWWTFGIFLYELLFGKTPFKGPGNRATLFNVVGQPIRFPEAPCVSLVAKDLIRALLAKEPQRRLGSKRGATEIKQHPFFKGVNLALVRCATPPDIPKPFDILEALRKTTLNNAEMRRQDGHCNQKPKEGIGMGSNDKYLEFEFF